MQYCVHDTKIELRLHMVEAPPYLVELCQPAAGVASRKRLRSATRQLIVVTRHRLSFYG